MHAPLGLAAVLFIFGWGDAAFPQTGVKGKLCSKCKTTGKIENPFMTEKLLALEESVLFCSYIFEEDRHGHGLPWLPCDRCKNKELEKEARNAVAKRVAEVEHWLKGRREACAFLKTRNELLHLETEHFVIAWNIGKIVTREKKVYKTHEALHLYAQRLEDFYSEFLTRLGIKDEEMRIKKHYIYLFEEQSACLKASKELCGLTCWNAAKMPGNLVTGTPSTLVSWKDKLNLKKDDDFHRHLIHHISHLLNIAYYRLVWLYDDAGWADEGLAHYFEMNQFNEADNTCDQEGEEEEFTSSDWEVDVRKLLASGDPPSFAEISIKSTTALHGVDHKLAWSFVDFLMERNPHRFAVFMKGIKNMQSARDALKEAYDLTFISFQTQWEAYVLENYRKTPMKKVVPKRLRRKGQGQAPSP
jgi:hypothetical protein